MKLVQITKRNKLLTIVVLIYAFLFIFNPEKANLSIQNSMYYVIEMLEIMPIIFILTSIIEAWVPKEVIMSGFGDKSGVKGGLFSFLLGSFSAGPIYAAFPVCKVLLKKGASINNVVIILSSWAVIKVPMLANEAKFLGAKFMGLRWILTVVSILIMSYLVAMIIKKEDIPIEDEKCDRQVIGIDIKEEYCIGCGLCEKLSPKYFEIADKKAKYKDSKIIDNNTIDPIIHKCPAKAISYKRA